MELAVSFWQHRADVEGDADAMYNIALCHNWGEGVARKDTKMFIKYLRLAVAKGHPGAQFELSLCFRDGLGVSVDLGEFVQLLRLAADQGYAKAQHNLGMHVTVVEQDDKKAAALFRLAANQGEAHSQATLGAMYAYGQGVAQDFKEAHRLVRLSANQRSSLGQYYLGEFYDFGAGVARSRQTAIHYYRQAAAQGLQAAEIKLA
jgi:TPR repeat protein